LVRGGDGGDVLSNTAFQPVGDALRIEQSARNVTVRNNVFQVQGGSTQGYDLSIAPDSEVGLSSDYNDLSYAGGGRLGLWEGRAFGGPTAPADWYYELGLERHSLDADPRFVNPTGADGTLGFSVDPDGSAAVIADDGGATLTPAGTWT